MTPTIASIKETVAAFYNQPVSEMVKHRNEAEPSRARQVAMYLAYELTENSLPAIGSYFGGRDHSTVRHAIKAVKDRLNKDPGVRWSISVLRFSLTSTSVGDKSAVNAFPEQLIGA